MPSGKQTSLPPKRLAKVGKGSEVVQYLLSLGLMLVKKRRILPPCRGLDGKESTWRRSLRALVLKALPFSWKGRKLA